MNRNSIVIKHKPELYHVDEEDEDQYYKNENKQSKDEDLDFDKFSKDLKDLPFMRNKVSNVVKNSKSNANQDSEDDDDGLDDQKKQELKIKNNSDNREFN